MSNDILVAIALLCLGRANSGSDAAYKCQVSLIKCYMESEPPSPFSGKRESILSNCVLKEKP